MSGIGSWFKASPETTKYSELNKFGKIRSTIDQAVAERFEPTGTYTKKVIAGKTNASVYENPAEFLKATKKVAQAQIEEINDPARLKAHIQNETFTLGRLDKSFDKKQIVSKLQKVRWDFELQNALSPVYKNYVIGDFTNDGKIISFNEVVDKNAPNAQRIETVENLYTKDFDPDLKYRKNGIFAPTLKGDVKISYIDASNPVSFRKAEWHSRRALNTLKEVADNNSYLFGKNKLNKHFEINAYPRQSVGYIGINSILKREPVRLVHAASDPVFSLKTILGDVNNTTSRLNNLIKNIDEILPEVERKAHFMTPWSERSIFNTIKYLSPAKKITAALAGATVLGYGIYTLSTRQTSSIKP